MSQLASFVLAIFGIAPTNPSPAPSGVASDASVVVAPPSGTAPSAAVQTDGAAAELITVDEMQAYLRAGRAAGADSDPEFFDQKAAFFERMARIPSRDPKSEREAGRAQQVAQGARLRAAWLRSQRKLDAEVGK